MLADGRERGVQAAGGYRVGGDGRCLAGDQVGKAFVGRKTAAGAADAPTISADELIAWSRDRMAGFKVPHYVDFLDALPLNATGR